MIKVEAGTSFEVIIRQGQHEIVVDYDELIPLVKDMLNELSLMNEDIMGDLMGRWG